MEMDAPVYLDRWECEVRKCAKCTILLVLPVTVATYESSRAAANVRAGRTAAGSERTGSA